MKKSRLLSAVLAMIMILTMSMPVFAAEEPAGSITVDNAVAGQTYTVYQVLDLESYDADKNAYAYKANAAWAEWLAEQTDYVSIDDQGYVTWVDGADAAKFAKLAKAYAKDKNIANQGSAVAESETVIFTGLDLGYYLMDSTLGVLCSLDTTNPSVTLKEKNSTTDITKEVQEDSTEAWGATNDADINQTVNFRSTITAYPGAENYVIHDKMSDGLTFDGAESVKIGNLVQGEDYTVVTEGICKECDFHVVFDQDYLDNITAETEIVVEYTATLNEDAVVGVSGNPNDVKLTYGENSGTEWDRTVTYTWDMDILKYGNEDTNNVLAGASFVLLNSDKSQVAVVKNGLMTGWAKITEDMDLSDYEMTTGKDGEIFIDGLDADKYFLRETVAPAGYNMLNEDIAVTIVAGITEGETVNYTTPVAEVNNMSGTELPSTGGMGTTILYILGGVLVIGAAAALIARRRTA